MKKLIFLCSIIMYCLSANAQTFTASPTTVTSGGTVTVTASGESLSSNIYNMGGSFLSVSVAAPNQGYLSDVNGSVVSGSITYYNTSSNAPTTFQFKPTSTAPVAVTATYIFSVSKQDLLHGGTTNTTLSFSVTISPVSTPTIYYSAPYSKSFVKSGCSAGYQGSSVTYSAVSGQFNSSTSQAAADQLAVNYVNAGGQAYANAHGTCNLLYYNTAVSQTFYRNNCGTGINGSDVLYTVPASMYSSTVSQLDANNKAQNDINLNGQNYANTHGTCTPDITYLVGPSSVIGGTAYTYTLPNLPPGYLAKWELVGQGYTDTVDFQVDDNSSSVYFNTMPNGTPNGTATLRVTIKNPNSTNPNLNFRATKEISITYCTVCP